MGWFTTKQELYICAHLGLKIHISLRPIWPVTGQIATTVGSYPHCCWLCGEIRMWIQTKGVGLLLKINKPLVPSAWSLSTHAVCNYLSEKYWKVYNDRSNLHHVRRWTHFFLCNVWIWPLPSWGIRMPKNPVVSTAIGAIAIPTCGDEIHLQ